MADTIVMIHGMWGGAWHWERFRAYFEQKGYKCVVPVLRHHADGIAEAPHLELGRTSLLDYVSDLELEIKKLDSLPIVMGHSMGGLLAQLLGARGLAKTLVLLTPAPSSDISALKLSVIKSFFSIMTTWGFWRKPVRQTFEEAAYSVLNLLSKVEQKAAFDRFGYESGRAVFEVGLSFLDRRNTTKVDAAKITCPTLVIGGAKDRITPVSVIRKVANKFHTVATYKEFVDHAHWILLEPGWEEVAGFAAEWLEASLNFSPGFEAKLVR